MVDDHLRVAPFHNGLAFSLCRNPLKFGSNLVRFFNGASLSSGVFALHITRKPPNWLSSGSRHTAEPRIETPPRAIGRNFTCKLGRTDSRDARRRYELCCHREHGKDASNGIEFTPHNRISAGCSHDWLHDMTYCREVDCHIEIISWRERRISASILVRTNEENVWQVLTNYERLAEFIPNLVWSERIPCPHPGRIWLLQRGIQKTMYWHIEACVVLDLEELPDLENGKELRFSMVDGDFKRYEGKWYLRLGPRPETTMLHYEVNVVPRIFFPAPFVERIIKLDLPVNLRALAERAEGRIHVSQREHLSIVSLQSAENDDLSSVKSSPYPSAVVAADHDLEEGTRQSGHSNTTQGAEVHMPPSKNKGTEITSDWGEGEHYRVRYGRRCRLERQCLADEIHFRRLDDLLENGGVHRRVVATITVKAPPEEVWAVLTAYEHLPEFVPNLANSRILFREANRVRLLQEGCKCLLYMALHARVVLDLWEQPGYEITFKQVEGDFDSFQGKWALEQFGSQHTLMRYMVEMTMRKDCLLSEAIVEEVIYEDLPSNLCAIRDRVELSKWKSDKSFSGFLADLGEPGDLFPSHSDGEAQKGRTDSDSTLPCKERTSKSRTKKPCVEGLHTDFSVLVKELRKFISKYGQEGTMPMRKFLRYHCRIDLEKAITAMGGFTTVAARMKLSLAYKRRKPKGYWDSLQHLNQELISFQQENGLDRGIMPTRRSMERKGRYDLARALEKWGGLQEVARILGLKRRARKSHAAKHYPLSDSLTNDTSQELYSHSHSLPDTGITGDCGGEQPNNFSRRAVKSSASIDVGVNSKLPYKTCISEQSLKWMTVRGEADSTCTTDSDHRSV